MPENEDKSNLISIAVHQLKTPLAGVKWALKMIIAGDAGPLTDEQRNLLQKCFDSNELAITMITDMLNAYRTESGSLDLDPQETDISELVQNSVYHITPNAQKKNIRIAVNFGEKLPKVVVDHYRVGAVMQNLLENALSYTSETGSVSVDVRQNSDTVEIKVADTGIGIPKAEQSKIFTKFYRASNAVKTDRNGSGLGLFVAKSIIEKHGGKMWFESEEGKGTTFYVSLPIRNS